MNKTLAHAIYFIAFAATKALAVTPTDPGCEQRGDYTKCKFTNSDIRYCIPTQGSSPMLCNHIEGLEGFCYQDPVSKAVKRVNKKGIPDTTCYSITLEDKPTNTPVESCKVELELDQCPFLKEVVKGNGELSVFATDGKDSATIYQNGLVADNGINNITDPLVAAATTATAGPVVDWSQLDTTTATDLEANKLEFPYNIQSMIDRNELPAEFVTQLKSTEKPKIYSFTDSKPCRVIAKTTASTDYSSQRDDFYPRDLTSPVPAATKQFLAKYTNLTTDPNAGGQFGTTNVTAEMCCTGRGLNNSKREDRTPGAFKYLETRKDFWKRFCTKRNWELKIPILPLGTRGLIQRKETYEAPKDINTHKSEHEHLNVIYKK